LNINNNKLIYTLQYKNLNLVDIAIIRSANSIIYDPRVKKIIGSLKKKYSILALGWNRDGIPPDRIDDYIAKVELFNLKTSFWKPSLIRILIRLTIFFPLFWGWTFIKLLTFRPAVVHACDLDTFLPCYIYKVLFGKKLVFDVFDKGMELIPQKFKKLRSLINFFENLAVKSSNALIIAGGEKVLNTFQKRPHNCEILLNCSEDYFVENKNTNLNDTKRFKLVYTGGIRTDRSLENITKAINGLDAIDFNIAGPIIDKEIFNNIRNSSHLTYHGVLQPANALRLEAHSHALISLYNPDVEWNNMTLPNKLFEAMMCGIPIITNVSRDIVNDNQCGIIVNYDNIDQIKEAIISLRDNPQLLKRLGNNGRKAYLEKYNWDIMEQRLYKLYETLIKNNN
jgi:glycosyltransferase involved in cell wall biosynthesis